MARAASAEQADAVLVLCWRRSDLRETSRLVTLLSAERGRITVLVKGAHRTNSAALGRLDLFNRLDVTLSGRGFPLLGRVRLVHEPRALRRPVRFAVATHLADLFDRAFVPERADQELFDLALGATSLAERAEPPRLPVVIAAVELRLLGVLGVLGDLGTCATCGQDLQDGRAVRAGDIEAGLVCARHQRSGTTTIASATAEWLRRLAITPGRELPTLDPGPALGQVLAVTGRWTEAALEHRPRFRALALAHPALRRTGA